VVVSLGIIAPLCSIRGRPQRPPALYCAISQSPGRSNYCMMQQSDGADKPSGARRKFQLCGYFIE
jgi:hypothetical protein